MAIKIDLSSGKGRKGVTQYDIEHAQAILREQAKLGIVDGKTIATKGYEFNGKDIVRTGSNNTDSSKS